MTAVEVPSLERKLVAILAADVVGYSRLMHEDEASALATLSGHRAIIDALISSCRGEISGTAGDSVLAEFQSVVDAVHCGVSIQQALTKENDLLDEGRRMMLRIGINVGDVMVKDGGIFGDGVNVAARLEAIAEPGAICVTRGVRDYIRDKIDYQFEDLGEHKVKNISRPVRVFRVVFDPHGVTKSFVPESVRPASVGTDVADGEPESEAVELAFWQSVQGGDPTEYEAYVQRFPQGAFVSLAEARLDKPGTTASDLDKSIEIEFWNSVKQSDAREMFEAYLDKYPSGEFRSLAELKLKSLDQST